MLIREWLPTFTLALLCMSIGKNTAAIDEDPDYATILDQCEQSVTTVEDCSDIIYQSVNASMVDVVVIHERSLEDEYYNQIVIPVDYQGLVLGSPPSFNSLIYYPFAWRGHPNFGIGTRSIGPFNCHAMTGVDCCQYILSEVTDRDINGKFVDCWIEESFRKTVEGELVEVYRNPFDNTVHELNEARLRRLEEREDLERAELILEITELGTTVHRTTFAQMANQIRHALRGYPRGQGLHYDLKMALRTTAGDQIEIDQPLRETLDEVVACLESLTAEGGLHRFGGVTEGFEKDVIVLKTGNDKMYVHEAMFLDLTEPEPTSV